MDLNFQLQCNFLSGMFVFIGQVNRAGREMANFPVHFSMQIRVNKSSEAQPMTDSMTLNNRKYLFLYYKVNIYIYIYIYIWL